MKTLVDWFAGLIQGFGYQASRGFRPALEALEAREVPVFMTPALLRQRAFDLTGSPFVPPRPPAILILDPPADGRDDSVGLTFPEVNAIRTTNVYDQAPTYFRVIPRAGTNRLALDVYVSPDGGADYALKTYADAQVDYSSPVIRPAIDPADIPPAGRVLSQFIVGHEQPGAGFPQFLILGADGFFRYNGFVPQTVGTSQRVGALNVFSFDPARPEDFPVVREVYARVVNDRTSNLLLLIDGEGFTGALSIDVTPGPRTRLDIDAYWYPRRALHVAGEPEAGFVTFSSMFFRGEADTPGDPTDEAHDADTLVVGHDDNGDGVIDRLVVRPLRNPSGDPRADIVRTDLTNPPLGRLVYFSLENRDRDPDHYSAFASADYPSRASYAVFLGESSIPLGLRLYEQPTQSEFNDNIVVNAVLLEDVAPVARPEDGLHIGYTAFAFFPDDGDADGLTDLLETRVGTDPANADSDGDSRSDGQELLDGTCPVGNCPPTLAPVGGRSASEGERLTFTARASDRDGKPVTYALAGAPAGAAIDRVTGEFTWTPSEGQGPGLFTFRVVARNAADPGLTDSETITVTVNEVNAPPAFDPIGGQAVVQGEPLTVAVTATDPDVPAGALTYRLLDPPAGARIDPSTGVFTWTPSPDQVGTFTVRVEVTDDGMPPLGDTASFSVTVLPPPPPLAVAIASFDASTATWYIRRTAGAGGTDVDPFGYGLPGWIPVVGDWDGDGIDTVGVFDPTMGVWYLRNSNSPGAPDFVPFAYGAPGWIPVVGDWDGDGTDTVGVVDPSGGRDPFYLVWYLRNANGPGAPDFAPFAYGAIGWTPLAGDWDGDGKATPGVFDPSAADWYLRASNAVFAAPVSRFAYGGAGWKPAAGDWDGDGTDGVGVVDLAGDWYLRNENSPGAPDRPPFPYGLGDWISLGASGDPWIAGDRRVGDLDALFSAGLV